LTESALGGTIGTTAFREAGVTLEVTPHIADDGSVAMIVTPQFSVLTGFTEEDAQPIIARRGAQTVVRVGNGQTMVLGGLRQRGLVRNHTSIPYLGDLKYVGALFRHRNDEIRESELLVFITPTIVTPAHFGTARELAAYETGRCELDKVQQPHCYTCQPPEDPTIYTNHEFFRAPVQVYQPPLPPPHSQQGSRRNSRQDHAEDASAGRSDASARVHAVLPFRMQPATAAAEPPAARGTFPKELEAPRQTARPLPARTRQTAPAARTADRRRLPPVPALPLPATPRAKSEPAGGLDHDAALRRYFQL
jgi:hypothetical protein